MRACSEEMIAMSLIKKRRCLHGVYMVLLLVVGQYLVISWMDLRMRKRSIQVQPTQRLDLAGFGLRRDADGNPPSLYIPFRSRPPQLQNPVLKRLFS